MKIKLMSRGPTALEIRPPSFLRLAKRAFASLSPFYGPGFRLAPLEHRTVSCCGTFFFVCSSKRSNLHAALHLVECPSLSVRF